MKNLRVLLVDDQSLFAESLRTFLHNYAEDMIVMGIASNGQEAIDMIRQEIPPDIILMDVRMPVMDGVTAVKKIKPIYPAIKIIMLSTYDEDEFVREALLSGASGYLLKDISPTELIISIRALNSGVMQISPSLAQKLIKKTYIEDKPIPAGENQEKTFEWLKTLTRREREIFALLATGHDNEEIAEQLGLALQTIRNQVSTIYSKLDVKDRFQIIQLANRIKKY
ncbi:MAG: response regulator transcription factor [Treponema sp.]|jgi:DNA-binding NarL/FixJ family response regulator|nr:response regulator transcription factor [Treponema sp.]